MSSSTGKKQPPEPVTKRMLSKLLARKKTSKTEGTNKKNDDDTRTCEDGPTLESSSASSTTTSKQKRKKKKTFGKDGATVGEDDDTIRGKKIKDESSKKKKVSKGGKREKTLEEAGPSPSVMPTVFEPVNAAFRPAVAHGKDTNEHIKGDMERLGKEEKEKQQAAQSPKPIDEFAPTAFDAPIKPAVSPVIAKKPPQAISPDPQQKPLYLSIPKDKAPLVTARERKDSHNNDGKQSAESVTTGKERSNKVVADSQDDADCKTAMIPASAVKVASYQMKLYKGLPRYEPLNTKPYEKSDRETPAKIQMLPQPSVPTSPTLPSAENCNKIKAPPKSPPAGTGATTSPGKNNNNPAGIVVGTLPKDEAQNDPKKAGTLPKDSPVSMYVAPLDR